VAKRGFFSHTLLFLNILSAIALVGAYAATHVSPESWWPLAFFGLSYPFLLLINLLFIIWWLWKKRRKRALLSTIIILIGFNHCSDFIQVSTSGGPQSDSASQVKVVSYNVRLFDLYDWSNHHQARKSIIGFLDAENADIYCFQEFYLNERAGEFETRDTMVTLLRANNVHEHYIRFHKGIQAFGVATFSAHPIVNKGRVDFDGSHTNFCIFTDININDDTIRVYNAHLASIKFDADDYEFIDNPQDQDLTTSSRRLLGRLKRAFIERAQQTALVMESVNASPHPVIICGDFNDTPVSYFYSQVTETMSDAFRQSGSGIGSTYAGKFPSFRIDYIFHSPELHSYQYQTHSEKYSDHYPISCWFEIGE
jgi:endonuclease/exonuclease/phosphatase family metal-dependent hydrolase